MVCAVIAMLLNLGAGITFVLGLPPTNTTNTTKIFSGYGFRACPVVTTMVEWVQLMLLVGVWLSGLLSPFTPIRPYGEKSGSGWPLSMRWVNQ